MTPFPFPLARGLTLALVLVTPRATATDTIERIGTLATARSVHTTTVLPSGALLVAGGMSEGGGSLATMERLDPGSGAVTPLPALAEARAGHTATALPDGRVVLTGGYNGDYLATVEVFDPVHGAVASGGRLIEGRSGHTATLLPDGTILLIGGVGRGWTFLASAEIYDPKTGRSEPVGPLSAPRESHTATLLQDGRVLVTGGHVGRRAAMVVHTGADLYDPATRRFRPTGELGIARHKHDAVRLADGKVLIVGGADRTDRRWFASTEIYDPAAGAFRPGPSMGNTRYKIQGTTIRLPDGDVLVSAGARDAEILDRQSFRFRPVPGSFPAAFRFATATPVPSGDVVIIGGYSDDNRNTAGIWRFRSP